MKKNRAQKLQLKKLTLHKLDGPSLDQVAGGAELALTWVCTISFSRILCPTVHCPVMTEQTCA